MNILIVDDNRNVAEAIGIWLEDRGYTVRTAKDQAMALRILDEHFAPKVLIADLLLPDASGETILAEAKKNHVLTEPAVLILMTGGDIPVTLPPEVPILKKPVDPPELLELLKRIETKPENPT